MKQAVAIYGVAGGLLIAALKYGEYRFLVVEHSVEIYGAIVAVLFAAAGIWVGLTLNSRRQPVVVREVPMRRPGPFQVDRERLRELGITPRELEILQLIARGMSTREIATTLFVSENTVKTHASRLLEKLGANRRIKAVEAARSLGLVP